MKRIYHLSSCSTCKRILKEINPDSTVELVDIKVTNIDPSTLDWIQSKVGAYEALFSKKAQKFRLQGLHEKQLSEDDYRSLLLERPSCESSGDFCKIIHKSVFIIRYSLFISKLASLIY
jgi:arsenate reductase-like glutaredoxin family protein